MDTTGDNAERIISNTFGSFAGLKPFKKMLFSEQVGKHSER